MIHALNARGINARAGRSAAANDLALPLPPLPAGWIEADPRETVGGAAPLRDASGAQVGTLTLVGGTATPAGWVLAINGDHLTLGLTGALDVPRAASDIVLALQTTDAKFIAFADEANARYTGVVESGSASAAVLAAVGGTVHVDGTERVTRADVHTAACDGTPHLLAARGADLTPWTKIEMAKYGSTWWLDGTIRYFAAYLASVAADAASREAVAARATSILGRRGHTLP